MKVLLYEQNANMQKKSGIGRALRHQKKALELNGIETTFDKNDSYDFVHFNSCFPKSLRFAKKLDKKGVPYIFLDNDSDLSENMFREFFKANKIHIYSENKCILHVNENYLSVQSIEDTGKVKVVLPQKRKITPLFENEESIYTDILCLKMKKYETKLFKLEWEVRFLWKMKL